MFVAYQKMHIHTIALVVAALLWSTSGVIVRGLPTPAFLFLFLRGLFSVVFLFPIYFKRATKTSIKKDTLKYIICGMAFSLYMGSFVMATRELGAAKAIAMQYSAPLYLFLLFLVKERNFTIKRDWTKITMLAMVIANIAYAFLGSNVNLGIIPAILCGLGYALFIQSSKNLVSSSPILFVAMIHGISCIVFLFLNIPTVSTFSTISLREIIIIALYSITVNILSYVLYFFGIKQLSSVRVGFITLIEPIMNPIWVYLILKEKPDTFDGFFVVTIMLLLVADLAKQKRTQTLYALESP